MENIAPASCALGRRNVAVDGQRLELVSELSAMTTTSLSPAERVEEWKGLYKQFRETTPSSPDWYPAIDYVVGAMISDHIDALRLTAVCPPDGGRFNELKATIECSRQAIEAAIEMNGPDPGGILLACLNRCDRILSQVDPIAVQPGAGEP
jgi:hypothetical protein